MENSENKPGDPQFRADAMPQGMTAHCINCGNSWPMPGMPEELADHQVCPKCDHNITYRTR